MTITINREALSSACSAIAALGGEGNSPTNKIAFLSLADGQLNIRGTDLTNWLTLSVPCDGEADAIQVDAGKLADLVGKLRGDEVKLSVESGTLNLQAGKSKRNLSGSVVTLPEPPPFTGTVVTIPADDLLSAIAFASKSMPGSEKPEFDGIRLQAGHAVAYNGKGFSAAAVADLGDIAVTLTPSTVKLLKVASGGPVRLTVGEHLVLVEWDGGSLVAKQLTGAWRFLDGGVDRLLPERANSLLVHPAELSRAINAVKAVADFDGSAKSERVLLRLSASGCEVDVSSQQGAGTEPFEADWDGPDIVVRFLQSRLMASLGGFAPDMPISLGILELTDDKNAGVTFRQAARPGMVGMLAQIR